MRKNNTSGFVYLWFDKKHKKYYIGRHWGSDNDKYVCSSTWMRNARKRRPQDFKRRILVYVYTNRDDLINEELRYLLMIKVEELGKRYYNLTRNPYGNKEHNISIKLKISQRMKRHYSDPKNREKVSIATKEAMKRPEVKEKITKWKQSEEYQQFLQNTSITNTGRLHTEEEKQKIKEKRKQQIITEDHKRKIGFSLKGRKNGPSKLRGVGRSEETKEKIRLSLLGKKHSQERIKINRLGQLKRYGAL